MDFTKECDIKIKLKGLKLQEQRIMGVKHINCQNHFKIQDEIDTGVFNYHQCKEFNILQEKLKQSFNEITLLYDDIQNNTKKKESLEELDIDDLKKEVFELLQKIKTLKMLIKSELSSRMNEQHIIEEGLSNSTEDKIKCYEQRPNTKLFNEIVPSPVRAIILSPFKSKEVQQYQDFLYNSPNRYGGWNEYNHNIFVKCWNRYINNKNVEIDIDQLDEYINNLVNSSAFKIFMDEIAQKISGTSAENVICHCKWYAKYLFFYNQQQKALGNWKESKAIIKQTQCSNGKERKGAQKFISYYDGNHKVSVDKGVCLNEKPKRHSNYDNYRKRSVDKETKEDLLIRLSKPINNQNYERNGIKQNVQNFDLENIPKLCTPNWRLNLSK